MSTKKSSFKLQVARCGQQEHVICAKPDAVELMTCFEYVDARIFSDSKGCITDSSATIITPRNGPDRHNKEYIEQTSRDQAASIGAERPLKAITGMHWHWHWHNSACLALTAAAQIPTI